jgi:DNA-binding LytR/AlgR family response regulator
VESSLKYMVVEDNELDQLAIAAQAARYPFMEQAGIYANIMDGLAAILSVQPELVFLDVDMPGGTGLELLRTLREKIPIAVFISSHSEYALEGFELEAFDYILKPLTEKRFQQMMARVCEFRQMKRDASAYAVQYEQEAITIKEGHNQVRVPISDIMYLEAMDSYTKLVLRNKKYMTLASLSNMLEQLPSEKFGRIHRSYAVAIDKVDELRSGELICGGYELPVGKTYKTTVSKWKL